MLIILFVLYNYNFWACHSPFATTDYFILFILFVLCTYNNFWACHAPLATRVCHLIHSIHRFASGVLACPRRGSRSSARGSTTTILYPSYVVIDTYDFQAARLSLLGAWLMPAALPWDATLGQSTTPPFSVPQQVRLYSIK